MLSEDARTKSFWERIIIGSFAAGGFFRIIMEDLSPRERHRNVWDAICVVKLDGNAEQIQLHIVIGKDPEMSSFELPYENRPEAQTGEGDSERCLEAFTPVKERLTEICRASCP